MYNDVDVKSRSQQMAGNAMTDFRVDYLVTECTTPATNIIPPRLEPASSIIGQHARRHWCIVLGHTRFYPRVALTNSDMIEGYKHTPPEKK